MNRTVCSIALFLAAVGLPTVCLGQDYRVAVISDDYYVYVHQAGGARINTLRVSDAQEVAMNRDGSRIAVLANDYYVKLFDGGGQLLNTLRVDKARDVAISGDGSRLAVISGNYYVKILDSAGKQLHDLNLDRVNAVSLNRDGSRILVLCGDYYVKLLDGAGKLLNTIRVSDAEDVALSGDGRRIAVLASGYYVKLFDPDGKQLNTLRINDAEDIALNDDGTRIAVLRTGTYARTYDQQGQQLTSFNVHKATRIAMSRIPVAAPVESKPQASDSPAKAEPAAPAKKGYPEKRQHLVRLVEEMLTGARANEQDKLAGLIDGLVIPQHETWFKRVFGDANGARLADEYSQLAANDKPALADFFRRAAGRPGRWYVIIDEFTDAEAAHKATGGQIAALRAMREPVTLYTVRFVGPSSKTPAIWSFVHVDGAFRLAGKMRALSGAASVIDGLDSAGDRSPKKADLPGSKQQLKGAARKSAKKVLKGLLGG